MPTGEIVQYVRGRAGESLRVVAEYDPDDFEIAYLRDDLGRKEVRRRTGVLHDYLAGGDRGGPDEVTATLGDPYASVQLRDRAVIVNLVTGDRAGVLVSMDTDVCQNLHGFVTECLARAEGTAAPSATGAR